MERAYDAAVDPRVPRRVGAEHAMGFVVISGA
jgi:hypothetical protein